MTIAFEISPLITASGTFGDKSGVYRYHLGLLQALANLSKSKDKKIKIVLFSFNRDLLLNYPLNPQVFQLLDNKTVFLINRLPQLADTNWEDKIIFNFPSVKTFLKILNRVLNLKSLYSDCINSLRFNQYLKFLVNQFLKKKDDVVFHSETGFFPLKMFKNIITIYDLTAVIKPQFHRLATVDLQKRKLIFAKKFCQGIICISRSTKEDLLKHSKSFQDKKIVIGYPGLDSVFYLPSGNKTSSYPINDLNLILKSQQNKIKRKKYLLYYGTFEPRKNLIYLVKAFTELQEAKEIPRDFKLILSGGEGWGNVKKSIINYIKENSPYGEKNNIIVLNYLSDRILIGFIKNAYALVYPSLYEGFGLPVLESMALGTPVICSHNSSLPEVGQEAVLYIDANNFFDLKDKIKYLINKPELAYELSKRGLVQSKKFTWNKTANKVYHFLEQLTT